MISQHESFPQPPDTSVTLWRYMDLSKFLSLAQSKVFWMSRADLLGDPFEGSSTLVMKALTAAQFAKDPGVSELISNSLRSAVTDFFVSCWHANKYESAAMWKSYSQSSDAVCVTSTFEKLARILPEGMYGGLVSYIDYDSEWFNGTNLFYRIMHKRRSFDHERECRFVAWSKLAAELGGSQLQAVIKGGGLSWLLDPNSYIDGIFVSPTAPRWFVDVVTQTAKDYSVDAPVRQSSILRDPIY